MISFEFLKMGVQRRIDLKGVRGFVVSGLVRRFMVQVEDDSSLDQRIVVVGDGQI